MRLVTRRPRRHFLLSYELLEFRLELLNALLAALNLYAAVGFYSDSTYYETAVWVWFATSVVNTAISVFSLIEVLRHHAVNRRESGELERERIESFFCACPQLAELLASSADVQIPTPMLKLLLA